MHCSRRMGMGKVAGGVCDRRYCTWSTAFTRFSRSTMFAKRILPTCTDVAPTVASSPISAGPMRSPAASTVSPARMSEPTARMSCPGCAACTQAGSTVKA